MQETPVRRGDVWWVDWNLGRGSEQLGERPAMVIQNDVGNEFSRTTIVAAVTTKGREYPFIVAISGSDSGLPNDSFVNLSQILTVDKARLMRRAGALASDKMKKIDGAIKVSLGLTPVE